MGMNLLDANGSMRPTQRENTLRSFQQAALMGAAFVEFGECLGFLTESKDLWQQFKSSMSFASDQRPSCCSSSGSTQDF